MTRDPETSTPLPPAPHPSGMTAERWRRIVGLVEVALDLERPLRGAYLEAVTLKDPELRRQVYKMLRQFGMDGFVDVPSPEASGPQHGLDPLAAERIGPYRLLKVLGRGGMGVVYLAERRDQEFERQVAVKVIGAGQEAPIVHQRFLSERQILARFDHPNIAKLFEGGTTSDGRPYFVLEYVEGLPLDAHCEEKQLPLEERLRLFVDVCSAVAYAHQNLVVHRDLKPSNILVDRDGKPKLLDFGIAKLLDPSAMPFEIEATRTAMRPMTPAYAAPEQISGGRITTGTDVYALGILLYRLLTGRPPFDISRERPVDDILALQRQDPPRPSQVLLSALKAGMLPDTWAGQDLARIARSLRGDLDNIVAKALRFEPEQRYTSVGKLADDLRRFELGEPVTATRDTPIYSLKKFVRRYRWVVSATAFVVATLVAFAIVSQRQAIATARERDKAEESARDARLTRDFLAGLLQVADEISLEDNKVPLSILLDHGLERLESGKVTNASVQVELYQVVAESYQSLRNYPKAAFCWQRAATLAEQQQRPAADLFRLHYAASFNFRIASDLPRAVAELEAAKKFAGPAEQQRIDLQLLDAEARSSDSSAFRERAQKLLAALPADPQGSYDGKTALVATEILSSYLSLKEFQGASAEVIAFAPAMTRLLATHEDDPEWSSHEAKFLAALSQSYTQAGDTQMALEIAEKLYRVQNREKDQRASAGQLLSVVLRANARIQAGFFDLAEVDLRYLDGQVGKLTEVDPRDPRVHYLAARAHLFRYEIARKRGGPLPQEELAAALELLAPLHDELGLTSVDHHYARALLLAGRREEAKTILANQIAHGILRSDVIALAKEAGLPHPPAPAAWHLDLPAPLRRLLDSPSPH